MASTIPSPSTIAPHLLRPTTNHDHETQQANPTKPKAYDVLADFHYYKDPGDGSPPAPSYVGKPETYERPAETRAMLVHDIRGEEDKYSLDKTGFQIWKHVSRESAFEDEDEIKKGYYPEVEDILKSA